MSPLLLLPVRLAFSGNFSPTNADVASTSLDRVYSWQILGNTVRRGGTCALSEKCKDPQLGRMIVALHTRYARYNSPYRKRASTWKGGCEKYQQRASTEIFFRSTWTSYLWHTCAWYCTTYFRACLRFAALVACRYELGTSFSLSQAQNLRLFARVYYVQKHVKKCMYDFPVYVYFSRADWTFACM
jgi:hypothetical protein